MPPPIASKHLYPLKPLRFMSSPRRVLLQSSNGPCPLLALANTLILRGDVELRGDECTFDELVQELANLAVDRNLARGEGKDGELLTLESATGDLLSLLPTLAEGLDVNPSFTSVTSLEYTAALAAFELLGVDLVHGWLVAADDPRAEHVAPLSYNRALDELIGEGGEDEDVVRRESVRSFLEESSSQLTYHGLAELHAHLGENQTAAFFRNNHFSTVMKHEGCL